MNQPSAEELKCLVEAYPDNPGLAIIDTYLLFKKSEPIPGAVDELQVLSVLENYKDRETMAYEITQRYDIYPKGTVARLTKRCDEAEAEVDRLKGDNATKPEAVGCGQIVAIKKDGIIIDSYICNKISHCPDCQAKQKTKAVGCGKFEVTATGLHGCGTRGILCPDCQAKANHVVQPHVKVSLPEVPFLAGSSNRNWSHDVSRFLQAVKAWIESQGAKP